MVKAMKDTMIYPNDGEWWGAFDSDGTTRLAMNETGNAEQGMRVVDIYI